MAFSLSVVGSQYVIGDPNVPTATDQRIQTTAAAGSYLALVWAGADNVNGTGSTIGDPAPSNAYGSSLNYGGGANNQVQAAVAATSSGYVMARALASEPIGLPMSGNPGLARAFKLSGARSFGISTQGVYVLQSTQPPSATADMGTLTVPTGGGILVGSAVAENITAGAVPTLSLSGGLTSVATHTWTSTVNPNFDVVIVIFSAVLAAGTVNPIITSSLTMTYWAAQCAIFTPVNSGAENSLGSNLKARRRTGTGRRLIAFIADSTLKVQRYNDAFPDTVGSTVTISGPGVRSCSLHGDGAGTTVTLYSESDVIYLRTSRDEGATWSVATTIATGYQGVTHAYDEQRGLLVAALFSESESRWYVTAGALGADGSTWTFSTPTTLVSSARPGADLRLTTDGIWQFAYVNTSGSVGIIRCRSLTSAGVGTWS